MITLLMLCTLSVVITGVAKLATGGKKIDHKTSNKLMILRVALQAVVIAIVAFIYFIKH
ncbi:MAG: HIG1 domain-containing protein [Alphaproteobacteria bacterium]|nr:HIG1 domain-containing protein [Alphaproteobacteria bacterium]